MKRRVCFFAKVKNEEVLNRVEFYAQDIRILRELGFDVHIATSLRAIRPADLYFVWWWTWAFAPIAWAKVLRRPVVVTGVFDVPSYPPRNLLEKALMRAALRLSDANVFCSQMEMDEIPALFRTRNPLYVHLAVDTQRYAPSSEPRRNLIVSVGWLQDGNSQRKGMPEVVQAAPLIRRAHPDVRFIVAGEKGSHYPVLQQMADDLGAGEYVEFPGAIPGDEKIRLMQTCRVYLQPTRHEGFGVAILEALSCGAPVVTRAAGAVSEVVGDAAEIVAGTSPEEIADAVIRLLDDEKRRAELSRLGRERAKALFSFEKRRESLRSILAALL